MTYYVIYDTSTFTPRIYRVFTEKHQANFYHQRLEKLQPGRFELVRGVNLDLLNCKHYKKESYENGRFFSNVIQHKDGVH